MNNNEFYKQFLSRHNFEHEDKDFLRNKFPSIQFSDIPEAWVCIIDKYLEKIIYKDCIKSVNQSGGIITINHSCIFNSDLNAISDMYNDIMLLDIDLYDALDSN